MRVHIGTLSIIAAAFFAGYWMGGKPPQVVVQTKSPNLENLQKLIDVDLEEYLQLKDQRKKYNKANEILAKVMKIFVADLGVLMDIKKQKELELAAEGEPLPVVGDGKVHLLEEEVARLRAQVKKERQAALELIKRAKEKVDDNPSENSSKAPSKVLVAEKKINEITTEHELEDLLNRTTVGNIAELLKRGGVAEKRYLQKLNGEWDGEIKFDDGKKTLEISLTIRTYYRSDGELAGENEFMIHDGGKLISKTLGPAERNRYGSLGEGSQAVVITMQGGRGLLQLYRPWRMSRLAGIYYQLSAVGEYQRKGIATLRKR